MVSGAAGKHRTCTISWIAALLSISFSAIAHGQNAPVADRTLEAVEALDQEKWKQVSVGLRVIQTKTASGIVISGFDFALNQFELELAVQKDPKGDRAHEVGEKSDATFVINAGFFLENDQQHLAPVGLLSKDGVQSGKNWNSAGGYLVLGDKILIRPTRAGPPGKAPDFVQTKPVLIEPGKVWAMNTNQQIRKRRTLFCLLEGKRVLVLLVTGTGMSLFEAGWLLRSPKWGGFFDCDSAIAMDGGGSSQSWMRDHKEYSLRGATPVHNFLVFKRREEG